MADVYFGTQYGTPLYPYNGNWTDVNQWYSTPGFPGEFGDTPGNPLGRLPTVSDTVYFNQTVLSNFPVTWSGPVVNLNLGSPTVNATGTWSGTKSGGITVYGTSTQPVISHTSSRLPNATYYFNGGLVTQMLPASAEVTFARDSRYNGPTTFSTSFLRLFIQDTAIVNANLTNRFLKMNGGTLNGTVTVQQALLKNATISNSPTITATSFNNNYETGPALRIEGTFTAPNTTLIRATNNGGTLTLLNTTIPQTISCQSAFSLIIDNSNVLGSFALTGSVSTRSITIQKNSIIAQDISTSVTNCYNFNIFSGTYTNPNPWIFGSSSVGCDSVNLGSQTHGTYSQPYSMDRLITDKNITIYAKAISIIYFNITSWDRYTLNGNNVYYVNSDYGIFTGLIDVISATGQTFDIENIAVGAGVYAPTKTISATLSGSKYIINNADIPNGLGFDRNVGGGLYDESNEYSPQFNPTIYISNLPSSVDVLASGI